MATIKETKEALAAINEIAVFLIETFKDGFQLRDVVDIWEKVTSNEEFRSLLQKAYEDYGKIPEELADIDLREMAELGALQLGYLPRIIESIRKK